MFLKRRGFFRKAGRLAVAAGIGLAAGCASSREVQRRPLESKQGIEWKADFKALESMEAAKPEFERARGLAEAWEEEPGFGDLCREIIRDAEELSNGFKEIEKIQRGISQRRKEHKTFNDLGIKMEIQLKIILKIRQRIEKNAGKLERRIRQYYEPIKPVEYGKILAKK